MREFAYLDGDLLEWISQALPCRVASTAEPVIQSTGVPISRIRSFMSSQVCFFALGLRSRYAGW